MDLEGVLALCGRDDAVGVDGREHGREGGGRALATGLIGR
jgi:hypothetical protein